MRDRRPRIIYSFDASMYSKTKLPDGSELLTDAFFLACCNDREFLPELFDAQGALLLTQRWTKLPSLSTVLRAKTSFQVRPSTL